MNYKEIVDDPQYTEIASVKHNEIKSLLLQEIPENQGWARAANMYQLFGVLALILGLFKAFMPFYTTRESKYLIYMGIGFLFSLTLLIVLHELIHALAYLYVGARKLSFGMNLRKFMFYVQSDGYVMDYKKFKIVALAPAIVITALSLAGMGLFYNQPLFFFFLTILGVHGFFCGGDFGLLCFFQNRPDLDVVTFDLKEEGKTYFYGKAKSEIL